MAPTCRRVINAGGIPRKNPTLNQVYANVLNKPVLVPETDVPSVGSAIFAFLAAGDSRSIEEAQEALCPSYVDGRARPGARAGVRGVLPAVPRVVLRVRAARRAGRRRRAACCRACAPSRSGSDHDERPRLSAHRCPQGQPRTRAPGPRAVRVRQRERDLARGRPRRHQAERRSLRPADGGGHGRDRPRRPTWSTAISARPPTCRRISRSTGRFPASAAWFTRIRGSPPSGRRPAARSRASARRTPTTSADRCP